MIAVRHRGIDLVMRHSDHVATRDAPDNIRPRRRKAHAHGSRRAGCDVRQITWDLAGAHTPSYRTFFARKLHTGLARLYRAAAREYRAPPPSTPPQQKRGLDDRQSEEPVPQASASEHVYKRPKPNDQVDEAQALPLTTNDLSFELFFGQPTWQTPFPSSVFPAVEPDQEPWSQGAGPWHSHPAGNTASEVPSDSGGPDAPWTSAPPAVAGQLNHLAWAGIDSESQQWWNALFLPGVRSLLRQASKPADVESQGLTPTDWILRLRLEARCNEGLLSTLS